jgi:hypothetical protein
MSNTEKIADLINKFRDVGTPIEEHAAKVFAHRDEFIAFLNSNDHSEEWVKRKLDNYGTWGIMAIAKEAQEKGLTFEEVESIRGEATAQLLKTAVESLIKDGVIKKEYKRSLRNASDR